MYFGTGKIIALQEMIHETQVNLIVVNDTLQESKLVT